MSIQSPVAPVVSARYVDLQSSFGNSRQGNSELFISAWRDALFNHNTQTLNRVLQALQSKDHYDMWLDSANDVVMP